MKIVITQERVCFLLAKCDIWHVQGGHSSPSNINSLSCFFESSCYPAGIPQH